MVSQFIRRYPKIWSGWDGRALVLGQLGRYRDARRAVRKALQFVPDRRKWEIAMRYGDLASERCDDYWAERWYRQALSLHSSARTHRPLGETLQRQGRFAEARRHLRRAIAIGDDAGWHDGDLAHYSLGLMLRARRRRYRAAAIEFSKALRRGRYTDARNALRDVRAAPPLIRMWDVEKRRTWSVVCSAMDSGPACTVELARRYTRVFPRHGNAWVALGNALGEVGQYSAAENALRRAGRCNIDRARLASYWGRLYLEKRDLRRAERWFRTAIKHTPSTSAHVFLGATLRQQGHLGLARVHFLKAIPLGTDPERDAVDEVYLNLGLVCRAQEKHREALRWFRKALRLDPRYEDARLALKDVTEAMRLRRRRA
jgi:tetratricopeptide (TPR) repeat protein